MNCKCDEADRLQMLLESQEALTNTLRKCLEISAGGWRPMETAPRDGARILAVVDGSVRVVAWGKTSHVPLYGYCLADQGVEDYDLCSPTAWMPLPEPPEVVK